MTKRAVIATLIAVVIASVLWSVVPDPVHARAAAIAVAALVLWLSEAVPPFVPTLLLLALVPLLLGGVDESFQLTAVLQWAADPVLALFFGGFALAVAASRYGLDRVVAAAAIERSRGKQLAFVALVAGATALLSMWLSNIAAAAMMIAAVRPMFSTVDKRNRLRRAALVAIAFGANFGGIGTPIGSGPNAIAMSYASRVHHVSFTGWMVFAVPLMLGLLACAIILIAIRFGVKGRIEAPTVERREVAAGGRYVVLLFAVTIAAWLTEPLHNIPAAIISILSTAALFGSGLLRPGDLARIDWSTLLLIAGGICVGHLLEESGLLASVSSTIPWDAMPGLVRTFVLCLVSASLASIMSNTGTTALLIPLVAAIDPQPSTAILIAMAASLGAPFVISTPPNAMAAGEGGLRPSDLAVPGLILMIGGCVLLALTGRLVLEIVGIP